MARSRTFLAVDVGPAIRASTQLVQQNLAKSGAQVKWVDPSAFHVTVLFLGDVSDTDLAVVCKFATRIAEAEEPFTLSVGRLGAFPNLRRPKVLWRGIKEGVEPLTRLHLALQDAALDLGGFRTEERGYTPHLTLGRTQTEDDGQRIAAFLNTYADQSSGSTTVDELLVMTSELLRSGPEYTVVGRAPLRGG
jgi:2'-5' RNA ligase